MKSVFGAAAALALLGQASAHYIFQQVSVGSQQYGVWEGVTDLSSKDLVCNKGALTGGSTTVLDAKVGDDITFILDTAVYHQGPISIFMSKADGSVQDYDGSGGWRKMFDWGPSGNSWPMEQKYTYKLPNCIPDGEYLFRIQSLGIHNPYPAGIPQFYISCAQLNITGGSGSSWEQPVQIPGVFKETDPGYTANIYDPSFSNYVVPGGAVMGC